MYEDFQLIGIKHTPADIAKIKGSPAATWPNTLRINWDLRPDHFYLVDDGAEPSDTDYSDLVVGWASLQEIDAMMTGLGRRTNDELWMFRPDKVAGAILHWSAGGFMTPPWLDIVEGELVMPGGVNRTAVCRALGIARIPFLYPTERFTEFEELLRSFEGAAPST